MNKAWLLLIPLLIALIFTFNNANKAPTDYKRVEVAKHSDPAARYAKAKLTPGRVVEFKTTRGNFDFVLYEKDCPHTTARVIDLVKDGNYNNIEFNRVEPENLIQTTECKKFTPPLKLEVRNGLVHEKGSVALAHRDNPDTGTSSIYILQRPRHDLDYSYTVFGRVFRGVDVVMKMKKGDIIKSANIRDFTKADEKQLLQVLQLAEEEKVNG